MLPLRFLLCLTPVLTGHQHARSREQQTGPSSFRGSATQAERGSSPRRLRGAHHHAACHLPRRLQAPCHSPPRRGRLLACSDRRLRPFRQSQQPDQRPATRHQDHPLLRAVGRLGARDGPPPTPSLGGAPVLLPDKSARHQRSSEPQQQQEAPALVQSALCHPSFHGFPALHHRSAHAPPQPVADCQHQDHHTAAAARPAVLAQQTACALQLAPRVCGVRARVLHREDRHLHGMVQLAISDRRTEAESWPMSKYCAPELQYASARLTTAVDMWAMGCLLVELMTLQPAFTGVTVAERRQEIQQALGCSAQEHVQFHQDTQLSETESALPQPAQRGRLQAAATQWTQWLPLDITHDGVRLVQQMLRFVPSKRASATVALEAQWLGTDAGALLATSAAASSRPQLQGRRGQRKRSYSC
eukprot:m.603651 g.603651  ORF g.603651 m.603651 type:complete len:416 (-) comp58103_c1_seq7:164-1411(-)